MVEELSENNVRYINGVLKSLREKLSDAKELNPENIELIIRDYEQAFKEASDLSSYLDTLRFTHKIEVYDVALLDISVDLGNLNKNLIEYKSKESNLEVKVDQEGTSFGGDPELAAPVEKKAYQPEEPSGTNLGSGTSIGSDSMPSLSVEGIEDKSLDDAPEEHKIDYKYRSGPGLIRRIPGFVKTLVSGAVIAGLLYSGYYGLKSCIDPSKIKKEFVADKAVSGDKSSPEEQDVPFCRYDGQFAFDSTKIIRGRKGLEKVIQNWPKDAPIYIAASSSIDGGADYNLDLSEDRANAIGNNISSIDIEKSNKIKESKGIGETDQFSEDHLPVNRRFIVSNKPLNEDKLYENAPAIGQATDGCGVEIEPEHYKVAKNGKYKKKDKDVTDKTPVPLPNEDGGDEPNVPIGSPHEIPVEKNKFNYPKLEDLKNDLSKKTITDDKPFINGGSGDEYEDIIYSAEEGKKPSVTYTHDKNKFAKAKGGFLVLDNEENELQNIELNKDRTDDVDGDKVEDHYIGTEPIKSLKDNDDKGKKIEYKGKIKLDVDKIEDKGSLNVENNTTLFGAFLDYIVPSADAAMIDKKPYAKIREWDAEIDETTDTPKGKEDVDNGDNWDNGLEDIIGQNFVADASYLTGGFKRKTLINEETETVEYDGEIDGIGAILGYKNDNFNVHLLMQSTNTKAKVKTDAFEGDYEEDTVGIGGGLEFNLGHKRKTNFKLDAVFEKRNAKQVYELVGVGADVKTDNTIVDAEIENKNLFIDGENYDLGLRLRGLQQFSSIKQDVTGAVPQEGLSKDVQYSDYQGGLVFDINEGKLNMKTTVDYVLMQRPDLSSDSILNGQSLLSRIELGKNTKLIALAEVPLGGDILRSNYGVMFGQDNFRIGDLRIKLPGWAIYLLSSNEELLTQTKTTKKNSTSVMFELKWNFDDDLFNFWNRTLQFN